MGSSTNIALPTIGREFAMDAVLLSWVAMAYTLAAAMFLLPFGRLGDIVGRKRIFTYGVSGYVITSLLVGFSISGAMLIVSRFVQGTCAAMMLGTSTAMLTSAYPPGERGRVLGINTAAVYIGLSVGPFIGGLMTQALGWRSIFLVGALLGVFVVGLAITRVKAEWADARGEHFDGRGAIIYGIAIVSFIYGMSRLPQLEGAGLIALGLVMGVVFVRWESSTRQPLLNMDLFRHNRVFAFSNLAALINYSATAAVGFLLSLYLQYIKALSPQQAGLVLIAQPIVQAIILAVGRPALRQDGVARGLVSRHGADHRWPGAAHLPDRRYAILVHPDEPDPVGLRLRPLLVPEHERGHGRGGPEAPGRGLGHGGHHAHDRHDAQPRHRDTDLRRGHRTRPDHTGVLCRLPRQRETGVHDLHCGVFRRDLRVAGAGKMHGDQGTGVRDQGVSNRTDRFGDRCRCLLEEEAK